MKILLVDNYDSFTYNLYHSLSKFSNELSVIRNDAIDFDLVHQFDKIVLSPGPGLPSESAKLNAIIKRFHKTKSILGICLGHQAIGEVFGLKLRQLKQVKHGEHSIIDKVENTSYLFKEINLPLQVGHYHSWVIDEHQIIKDFEVTSFSKEGLIMSISHKKYDINGIQFHPESILTPQGNHIIENWIKY